MTTLKTERLILRPFCASDEDWLATTMANRDVARWIPLLPHPYEASDARAFIALQTGPNRNAVAVTQADQPIGCITIAIELGYWFNQSAWGNGFATEASRAIVSRHFANSTETLTSGYILDNDRSRNVLEKLGFVPTEQVQRQSALLGSDVTIQRMQLEHLHWQARS